MKNKKTIYLIAGFIILAVVSFYAGSKLSGSNNNGPQGQAGASFGPGGQNPNTMEQKNQNGNGMINGTVMAKDENSITVQLKSPTQSNDTGKNTDSSGSGSKIIFYTGTTTVSKTIDGAISDIEVGKNVNIIGTTNTDGSISAQNISIKSEDDIKN
ncbi:MAG TPA: hypothetical protein PKZ36_01055 [Candidatus Paceibacterota bacterium]|nr:hypothetical protein [Candidatus Paceibacterota bacterium]HPT17978.1 hypothetical protein [Candidatus Paceibacterota bacterium]